MKDLQKLFDDAKAKNEHQFVLALINYRGPDSKFSSSSLFEWFDAIQNYERWYRETGHSLHEKGRFSLLIYSTFFEVSDLYLILGNLSRIAMGYQVTPYLYWKHEKESRWFGASEKISLVEELLIDSGFASIQEFFNKNHFAQIRNAFFHSTYAFDNDDYILNEVETLYIDYIGHHTLSLTDFIFPKIEVILEFVHSFKDLYVSHIKSYRDNKTFIDGSRDDMRIEILGLPDGLVGYRDVAGNSLELKDDVWLDANGHLALLAQVDRHVSDELDRFSKKEKISTDDGSIQHLCEVVVERNIQAEREKLGGIYAELGDKFLRMYSSEQNHFRTFKLRDITQKFYDRMSELSPIRKLHPKKSLLKYVTASGNEDGLKLKKEAVNELLQFLRTQITEEALTNVSRMLPQLKRNGADIETEKKAFVKILRSTIPPELKKQGDQITIDIDKL